MTFIVDGSSGLTFPNSTVQAVAAQTGPAVGAYLGTNQTITSGTSTKILYDTEDFDTNSNFDSSRFTPTVAGYYMITAGIDAGASTAITRVIIQFYKNGASYTLPMDLNSSVVRMSGSYLIYLNGSTDYVEIYGWIFAATAIIASGRSTYFNAFLARSA